MPTFRIPFAALSCLLIGSTLVGCGQEEAPYTPVPPVEGINVQLPPVPAVPEKQIKDGDAYTVWGVSYSLRNRVHEKEVADQDLSITGYIIKTNIADAPECAVHKGGEADPEDCHPSVPTFWIGDTKDADLKDSIMVMG